MAKTIVEKLAEVKARELEPTDAVHMFWNSLDKCKVKNGILRLHATNPFDEKCRSIVVRECYERFWETFYADNKANTLVTGCDGVGKSTFLYYAMWKLKKKRHPVILVTDAYDEKYIFYKKKVFLASYCSYSGFCSYFERENEQIEVSKLVMMPAASRSINGRTLNIASEHVPQSRHLLELENFVHYFMPIWTFEECLLKYESCYADKFSKSEFLERFEIVGGIPSRIFCNYEGYCEALEESIDAIKYYGVKQLKSSNVIGNSVLERLLVHNVDPIRNGEKYYSPPVEFCSGVVLDIVSDILIERNHKTLLRIVGSLSDEPKPPIDALLRLILCKIFAEGGNFAFRKNGSEEIKQFDLGKQQIKSYRDIDEINSEEPGFYLPRMNDLSCIDGILVSSDGAFAIQVSLRSIEAVIRADSRELKGKFGKFGIIFLVPEWNFKRIKVNVSPKGQQDQTESSTKKLCSHFYDEFDCYFLCLAGI